MNSLASVLVGVSLTGVLIALGTADFVRSSKKIDKLKLEGELLALRGRLINFVDCDNSLAAYDCSSPGKLITLRDNNGDVLYSGSGAGTKFGDWTVRAECSSSKDGLLIRAARLRPSGTLASTNPADFFTDPISGQNVTWTSQQTLLFPNSMALCPVNDKFTKINGDRYKISPWYTAPYPRTYTHNLNTNQYFTKIEMYDAVNAKQLYEATGLVFMSINTYGFPGYGVLRFFTDDHQNNDLDIVEARAANGTISTATFDTYIGNYYLRTIVVPYGF